MRIPVTATLAAVLCAIMLPAGAALAADYTIKGLTVSTPWTRATPAGATVAGGFLKIENKGTEADRLIGGSFAKAATVQIHEMAMDGDVMRMREMAGGLEIKPGAAIELKPKSYHVMFIGLKEPIKEGGPIAGSLVFEKAGKVDVEFEVRPLAAKAPH